MFYVGRDSEGRITEAHPAPFGNATEALPEDSQEVLQFIHERWRQNELEILDREFIRVIEDTIELLIEKKLILFTDLPPRVQTKLLRRREVRQQVYYPGNFGSDDDIIPL